MRPMATTMTPRPAPDPHPAPAAPRPAAASDQDRPPRAGRRPARAHDRAAQPRCRPGDKESGPGRPGRTVHGCPPGVRLAAHRGGDDQHRGRHAGRRRRPPHRRRVAAGVRAGGGDAVQGGGHPRSARPGSSPRRPRHPGIHGADGPEARADVTALELVDSLVFSPTPTAVSRPRSSRSPTRTSPSCGGPHEQGGLRAIWSRPGDPRFERERRSSRKSASRSSAPP